MVRATVILGHDGAVIVLNVHHAIADAAGWAQLTSAAVPEAIQQEGINAAPPPTG